MQKPQWLKLNKRILFPVLGLAVLIVIGAVIGKVVYSKQTPSLPPEELWEKALQNTRSSNTYRYQVEILFNNKTNLRGEGERVFPDKVHLKGTMENAGLEFIQIGEKGYMKDPYSKQWVELEGNQLSHSELFITELNPLGMFNFKDIPRIKALGPEKIGNEEYQVLSMSPNVVGSFMENYLNFEYKVWISEDDCYIKQADISAVAKGPNQVKFNLKMRFSDFNENISINAPEVSKVS